MCIYIYIFYTHTGGRLVAARRAGRFRSAMSEFRGTRCVGVCVSVFVCLCVCVCVYMYMYIYL